VRSALLPQGAIVEEVQTTSSARRVAAVVATTAVRIARNQRLFVVNVFFCFVLFCFVCLFFSTSVDFCHRFSENSERRQQRMLEAVESKKKPLVRLYDMVARNSPSFLFGFCVVRAPKQSFL
jgi:hypothetical protein